MKVINWAVTVVGKGRGVLPASTDIQNLSDICICDPLSLVLPVFNASTAVLQYTSESSHILSKYISRPS